MAVVQYAAYLFRKRAGNETAMPRFLRLRLNNILFSQKERQMAATFDDGILTIYSVENIAEPGDMPVTGLVEKASFYFGYETVGINRFYTALQANRQIESVVHIPVE